MKKIIGTVYYSVGIPVEIEVKDDADEQDVKEAMIEAAENVEKDDWSFAFLETQIYKD